MAIESERPTTRPGEKSERRSTEYPPTFSYELGWATDDEKCSFIETFKTLNRQTMNLRKSFKDYPI